MNPYREAFYQRQSDWHDVPGAELEARHRERGRYFAWYTRGWLPPAPEARILDIGCGAGQFVHFLRARGYSTAQGIDLDARQIASAAKLGLPCQAAEAGAFIAADAGLWDQFALLDVLEHLTFGEIHALLEQLRQRLAPEGTLLVSVPNAESPTGLEARYGDITHETAFTVAALDSLLFCHGLRIASLRDPWPAPVDLPRRLHRAIAQCARLAEAGRLRLLGLRPPRVWSPVFWCLVTRR